MTAPETMTDCPIDDEDLAAFVEGRLSGDARRRVVEHCATCGTCRDILRGAAMLQAEEAATTNVVPFRGGFGKVAAALAVAASVAIVFFALPQGREWWRLQRTDGMSAVVEAQNQLQKRPIEARLSGGSEYRRFQGVNRGEGEGEPAIDVADAPLWNAWDKVQKHPRALAATYLLMKDFRAQAVPLMEQVVKETSNPDPLLLNDLAAAYVESARYQTPGAAQKAVDTAERAWRMAKTPEIAWNRALAYDQLDRDQDAIRAWQDYLDLDSSSPWADEARSKQQDLKDLQSLP